MYEYMLELLGKAFNQLFADSKPLLVPETLVDKLHFQSNKFVLKSHKLTAE